MLEDLVPILIPIGVCVVLPVMIVWLVSRTGINETNKRTEIALEAIRNNHEINLEEFLKQTAKPEKPIKEKLMSMLQRACVCIAVGLALSLYVLIKFLRHGVLQEEFLIAGVVVLFIGIAFLITYFISKRNFAKELEASETSDDMNEA